MKTKPWPLIVIAILHLLSPVGNIIVNSYLANVSINRYIQALFSEDELFRTAIFLLIPILGGALIYQCKRWSYNLYLIIMTIPFIYSYLSWESKPTLQLGVFLGLAYLVNLFVVGYFILPQVRKVYFDPRLRWWETKPRFSTEFSSVIKWMDESFNGNIKNISEGGLFIETNKKINTNARIFLECEKFGFNLFGEVMYCKPLNNNYGYGISLNLKDDELKNLKQVLNSLSANGSLSSSRAPNKEDSFRYWLTNLILNKKGFLPQSTESLKKVI